MCCVAFLLQFVTTSSILNVLPTTHNYSEEHFFLGIPEPGFLFVVSGLPLRGARLLIFRGTVHTPPGSSFQVRESLRCSRSKSSEWRPSKRLAGRV